MMPIVLALAFLVGSISQGFNQVRSQTRQAIEGDWAYANPNNREGYGLNKTPQAKQVTTVTVADQGDNISIIITLDGVNVTYNTGTGAALAAIGAGLAAAINQEPLVAGKLYATFATATLTLTGLLNGSTFTVSIASDPSASLSAVTTVTSAASAAAVKFARAIIHTSYNSPGPERCVGVPVSTLFTAQVITFTVSAYVASSVIAIDVVEVRGNEEWPLATGIVTEAVDLATSLTALAADLNAKLAANTVLAAAGATTITLTAEVLGTEIRARFRSLGGGATHPTATLAETTGPSISTSLNRALRGASLYSPVATSPTNGTATATSAGQYRANEGVRVAEFGDIWVGNSQSPSYQDTVYVETAAGDDCGRFYSTSSATRIGVAKNRMRWEKPGRDSADSLALLHVEF